MKKTFGLPASAMLFAFASCSPMTPADYAGSKEEQRAAYPELEKRYRDGQTSRQIVAQLPKADRATLIGKQSASRPAGGWDSRSWEFLEEQSGGQRVAKVDRYTFGSITSYLAAAVYHHRVFFDQRGRSIGWYVTHD